MDLKNFNEEKESDGNHKHPIEEEVSSDLTVNSDILSKILASLPPKSLLKFKCVSKEIINLIEQPLFISEHFRTFRARKPFTGFFYQNHGINSKRKRDSERHFERRQYQSLGEPFYVSTYSDAGHLPDSSLSFLKEDKRRDYIELIDSSNGLLLCKRTHVDHRRIKMNTYHVCNPRTMEKVVLPHPPKKISTPVLFALLAQSTPKGFLRYMVICICRAENKDPWSELSIFSSETGEWKEFKDRLPVLTHENEIGLKVVVKDVLFWDCLEDYILVCYYEKSGPCFDVIKAPKAQFRRCLWDYNGKLLCYCHGYDEEFPAWSLSFNGNNQFEWKQEDSEQFLTLTKKLCTEYCRQTCSYIPEVLPQVPYRILAYDPDSNTIYLLISDLIFSFGFKEYRLERIFNLHLGKAISNLPTSPALPYVHCFMPIEFGGKSAEVRGNES